MRLIISRKLLSGGPLVLCIVVIWALLSASARGAVKCGAETFSCGGCPGVSTSCRADDSVAQGPIGPVAEGGGVRAYDGFFLVLPNINVPVDGACFAVQTESGSVMLRWTLAEPSNVNGINIYRSTSDAGPFIRMNQEVLPARSPGSFEDTSVWPATTFWYEVRLLLNDGHEDILSGSPAMVTTGGRLTLALSAPRPNPFRESTSISFDVPDHVGTVHLAVFNVQGQEIRRLVDGGWERGRHQLMWDGRDSAGREVSSGVYFMRLEADGDSRVHKAILLR